MQRIANFAKKHRYGQMPKVDWLNRLSFWDIELINIGEKSNWFYVSNDKISRSANWWLGVFISIL